MVFWQNDFDLLEYVDVESEQWHNQRLLRLQERCNRGRNYNKDFKLSASSALPVAVSLTYISELKFV